MNNAAIQALEKLESDFAQRIAELKRQTDADTLDSLRAKNAMLNNRSRGLARLVKVLCIHLIVDRGRGEHCGQWSEREQQILGRMLSLLEGLI